MSNVRRVMTGYWLDLCGEQIEDDPGGTHYLVPVEVWEKTCKERDTALQLLADYTDWIPGQGQLEKRKPTHGPCCTCDCCGHFYDDCVCEHNAIDAALAEIGENNET